MDGEASSPGSSKGLFWDKGFGSVGGADAGRGPFSGHDPQDNRCHGIGGLIDAAAVANLRAEDLSSICARWTWTVPSEALARLTMLATFAEEISSTPASATMACRSFFLVSSLPNLGIVQPDDEVQVR
ncbi:hypothetical protein JHW44_04215 [Paracoccus seriniphilus]|nr:hypothetical protein JHW44_04215 [Paracoccus seriniphilus]